MKQVLQNLKSGVVSLEDVPAPQLRGGHVLVRTRSSLISAGTERMLVEFGQAGLVAKARQQPDKVKQVLQKIQSDGLLPTLEAVFSRLDEPLPLGYCNAGVVIGVGPGVTAFRQGDRVASNGPHAEFVLVPETLCAEIPDSVSDDEAAFVPLAAVALQGIRLIAPELGERIVVTGLGLVGLLAAQLLLANGCEVLGLDYNAQRVALAEDLGVNALQLSDDVDAVRTAESFSKGSGVDAVLVAASTKSSEPIHQAAQMCRQRGRIVLVGATGLELSRADFYKKELTFQVSCSYGPGRYDPSYENRAIDYPFGFVRWTVKRNFQAVLKAMAHGGLSAKPLVSHRVAWSDVASAYDVLTKAQNALGILLEYPEEAAAASTAIPMSTDRVADGKRKVVTSGKGAAGVGSAVAGVIGAGNFARATLLPSLAATGVRLRAIADINGVNARHLGKKFGFEVATTDYQELLTDLAINLVFIATRHDQHARMIVEALRAGKSVFVEKPLCLNRDQLKEIKAAWQEASSSANPPQLAVGFNRRFAPHVQKMRSLLASRTEPLAMTMLVNAGPLPSDHWLQDPALGGGRLIGEGVHFIDLMRHIAGSPIADVSATAMDATAAGKPRGETSVTTLRFEDGSMATVQYLANGGRSFPKERLSVFSQGRILELDNFRMLRGYGWAGFRKMRLGRQDKGHRAQFQAMANRVAHGGEPLVPFAEIEEVTLASFQAAEQVGAV